VPNTGYVFASSAKREAWSGIKKNPTDWCIVSATASRRSSRGARRCVVARMSGQSAQEIDRAFPTVEDGVKGLAFVKAAMESSATRQWRVFEMPSI
jgi:hypothetical protein